MKKFIFTLLLCLCIPLCTAFAELMPVKDAWLLGSDGVVILREDGRLYAASSIDTQEPTLVASGVRDFLPGDNKTHGILYENGDAANVRFNFSENDSHDIGDIEIEKFGTNGAQLYNFYQNSYLDNSGTLHFLYSSPAALPADITIDNVKELYSTGYYSDFYIISDDNTAYKIKVTERDDEVSKTQLLTDVKEIFADYKKCYVLRNNGDLFDCSGEIPERIAQNVISAVLDSEHFYYIDADHNLYNEKNKNIRSGVQSIYCCDNDGWISCYYYIDDTGELYQINSNGTFTRRIGGAKDMLGGTRYFFVGEDGSLYNIEGYNTGYCGLYLQDIANVKKYAPNLNKKGERYLFITNKGELWAAFGETWEQPFLTAFCQKPTVVKINQTPIELTAKIQNRDNRSMYPFRECLENMGATVIWDSANKIAIGEYGGKTVEFPIGKAEYVVNGTVCAMDTSSYIDPAVGRTYIPIRYAAEALGFKVDWITGNEENTISIYKN